MRFKPLTQKQKDLLFFPIVLPIVILCIPVVISVFLSYYIILKPCDKLYNKYKNKQIEKGWHLWYAWRPTLVKGGWGEKDKDVYIWLENIERKLSSNGWGWSKRLKD